MPSLRGLDQLRPAAELIGDVEVGGVESVRTGPHRWSCCHLGRRPIGWSWPMRACRARRGSGVSASTGGSGETGWVSMRSAPGCQRRSESRAGRLRRRPRCRCIRATSRRGRDRIVGVSSTSSASAWWTAKRTRCASSGSRRRARWSACTRPPAAKRGDLGRVRGGGRREPAAAAAAPGRACLAKSTAVVTAASSAPHASRRCIARTLRGWQESSTEMAHRVPSRRKSLERWCASACRLRASRARGSLRGCRRSSTPCDSQRRAQPVAHLRQASLRETRRRRR